MEPLEPLSKVAESATPGPWRVWGMSVMADPKNTSDLSDSSYIAATEDHRYDSPRTFNAQHIATFDPPTTLRLLDELERLRGALLRIDMKAHQGTKRLDISRIAQGAMEDSTHRPERYSCREALEAIRVAADEANDRIIYGLADAALEDDR